MKIVEIWLTQAEQEDEALHQTLQKLYQDYSRRKFKVAQFHSGAMPPGICYYSTGNGLLRWKTGVKKVWKIQIFPLAIRAPFRYNVDYQETDKE